MPAGISAFPKAQAAALAFCTPRPTIDRRVYTPETVIPRELFPSPSTSGPGELKGRVMAALVDYQNSLPDVGFWYGGIYMQRTTVQRQDAKELWLWLNSLDNAISDNAFLKQFLFTYRLRQATKPSKIAIVVLLRAVLLNDLRPGGDESRWIQSDRFITQKEEREKRVVSLEEKAQRSLPLSLPLMASIRL